MQVQPRAGDRILLGGPDNHIDWLIIDVFDNWGEVLAAPVVRADNKSTGSVDITESYQPSHVPTYHVNRMIRALGELFPARVSVREQRRKPLSGMLSGVYLGSVSPSDLDKIRRKQADIYRG